MRTLVIAEQANGQLKSGTLNAISAATQLGFDIDVLLWGHAEHAQSAAEQAAHVQGVSAVRVCLGEPLEKSLAENLAALISGLVPGCYSHVLADASSVGRSALPRVAACLDVGMLSDVTAVVSADTFKRPIYAGNAVATVQALDDIKLLTTRASAFQPAQPGSQSCAITRLDAADGTPQVRFVSERITASDRPELTNAKVVISGGRGLQSKANFALIERVADKLGAAVGASRAAVDAGFAANDLQVGQTGKIVAPQLYVAVGISGAIQHLAGMSGSKVIVAINQDAEAPIGLVADYLLVADLFQALPELERAL